MNAPTSPEVHREAAQGFAAASRAYERGRPSFPDEAVAMVRTALGAAPGVTIVDVGAGTGKLTRLLAPTGARIVAVEPIAQMRAILLEQLPDVLAVGGVAERLPLETGVADGIVVAQAFHWFDGPRALAEFARVLRPGGTLTLIWNVRDTSVPWVAAIGELIEPYRGDTPSHRDGRWREAFAASPAFSEPIERVVASEHRVTPATVVDRHLSISFVATRSASERARLAAEIRGVLADDPQTRGRARFGLPQRTIVVAAYAASATTA